MRAASLLAVTSAFVLAPALPVAGSERMTLACGGDIGTIERSNGASWWSVEDGTVWTTKYLEVVHPEGVFERSYGHVAREHVVCEADHDVDGYESDWTVHLVRAG